MLAFSPRWISLTAPFQPRLGLNLTHAVLDVTRLSAPSFSIYHITHASAYPHVRSNNAFQSSNHHHSCHINSSPALQVDLMIQNLHSYPVAVPAVKLAAVPSPPSQQ